MILAATSNGLLYQSLDRGASWRNRPFPAQHAGELHALEVDPRVPDIWYAGVASDNQSVAGVYQTSDGGTTWKLLPGLSGRNVWALAIWPAQPDVVAAGTADGVYLSENSGATWKRISPESNKELRPVVSLAFHPTNRDILYAGTTHLPWRTRDGGAHWESIHSGMLDDSDVFSIAVESRSPSTVFASACSGVYRSEDGANSWKRMPTPPGAFRTYLVTLEPRRSGVVFAATSAGLLKSTTSGAAWKRVSQHAIKSIAFDPANADTIYFASATGGLLLSRDGGNTLQETNIGFSNRNFSAFAGSGSVLYASTVYEPGSGGIFRSGDLGVDWRRMPSPGGSENVVRLTAAPDDPDRLYAAGYRSLYRSSDGARTWVTQAPPRGSGNVTAFVALARESLLLATSVGFFRLSGGAWTAIELPGGRRPVDVLQSSGGGVTAALTSAGAFRSEDGGVSWTACGQPVAEAVWYGLAFDTGAETALAATSRGLFRSTNRCAAWLPVVGGLDQGTVSAVVFHPRHTGEALATQYGLIFRSSDAGRTWSPLGNDAGHAYPSALLVLPEAPQRLFAPIPRRGVFSISIDLNQPNSTAGGY
jgi:photosystem II stability/assembly factor-like uncharacterized protein